MRKLLKSRGKRSGRFSLPARLRAFLRVEELESRTLPSTTQIFPMVADHVTPLARTVNLGPYKPAQITSAYGFNQQTNTGAGQTIAIVDAFDDPTIASDLQTFNNYFTPPLPTSTFIKVNQNGNTSSLPPPAPANDDWTLEVSLDVEWAHVVAPGANIVLVEATSDSWSDMMTAVNTAANPATYATLGPQNSSIPAASVVSMSWGGSEFTTTTTRTRTGTITYPGETTYDSIFAAYPNVTFVASSGDDGAPPIWPAVSPYVVGVGGTRLTVTNNTYGGETGWSDSGGGVSKYEPMPSYQSVVAPQFQTGTKTANLKRTSPDVAYNADPNSGVYVLDNYDGGWWEVGGTSAGAPQWAGLFADVNQLRASPIGSAALPALYSLTGVTKTTTNTTDFHDITSGNNGYAAKTGYDLVTGLGSPIANGPTVNGIATPGIISALAASNASHLALATSTQAPATTTTSSRDGDRWSHSVDIRTLVNDPSLMNALLSGTNSTGPWHIVPVYFVAQPAPVTNLSNGPAVTTIQSPLPTSRTAVPVPLSLLSSSIESKTDLPDDADAIDPMQDQSMLLVPDAVAPAPLPASLRVEPGGGSPAPVLSQDQAVDACFAHSLWSDGQIPSSLSRSTDAAPASTVEQTSTPASRSAASAALFVMLGAVWTSSARDNKSRVRRWNWR